MTAVGQQPILARQTGLITWKAINEWFAPFEGSAAYAIRADAFFHLALKSAAPVRFRLKNRFYPALLAWRALTSRAPSIERAHPSSKYLFVSDYAAEPGFGTLSPLLCCAGEPLTFVGNYQVVRSRQKELARLSGLSLVAADMECRRLLLRNRNLVARARSDFHSLFAAAPREWRPTISAARQVILAQLLRVHGYEGVLTRLLERLPSLRAVITHNDFASLSHVAGMVARRFRVPDITLQHGFPSMEYFPISASYYLVWGQQFAEWMGACGVNQRRVKVVGAPRLEELSRKRTAAERATAVVARRDRLRVLLLSQTHSLVFAPSEHSAILNAFAKLTRHPSLDLLVKLHPQEHASIYETDHRFRSVRIMRRDVTLMRALNSADVVVSVNSTAILEAMLMRVPVIQFVPPSVTGERIGPMKLSCRAADDEALLRLVLGFTDPEIKARLLDEQDTLLDTFVAARGESVSKTWQAIREIADQTGTE